MGILVSKKTKVVCQGILSPLGLVHTEQALTYGTHIVAGVAPGKKGETILGIPLFETLKEAVHATHPNASVIFSSPTNAKEDIKKALDEKIPLIVCPTERVPVHDILSLKDKIKRSKSLFLGPATQGIITTEECKIGTMPAHLFTKGNIGIISRSSSIMYEAIQQLKTKGLGVSSCVTIGAYPILSTDFTHLFNLFQKDKQTDVILLIGEIGGFFEQKMASYYAGLKKKKPLICYIAGMYVPPETYLGNLSAIIKDETQTAEYKKQLLERAGATIVSSPALMGDVIFKTLTKTHR